MGKKSYQNITQSTWESILDEPLSLDEYMNTLKQKLNRVNGTLAKVRYGVSTEILKTL